MVHGTIEWRNRASFAPNDGSGRMWDGPGLNDRVLAWTGDGK